MKQTIRLLIFSCVLLISCAVRAQFINVIPDCCDQAIRLQFDNNRLRLKLDSARVKLDTAKAVGTRLLKAKDLRIADLESTGNDRIRELKTKLEQTDLRLSLAISELEYELLRGRFLGLGRRQFIGGLLKKIKPK